MNKVELIGRLTKDVDLRYSQDGKAIGRFNLAVDRKYKKDNAPTADFINAIIFDKAAETIQKYTIKGSKLAIIGHIQTGSYTNKDGQKVYTTDVVVDEFEFLDSKKDSQQKPKTDEDGFMEISDDEIPFV